VAYLLKARTVEPEKPTLLGNGCVTYDNGVNVGSVIFCTVFPGLYKEDQLSLRESLETATRKVGCWCEMAASLPGREPGSRVTSTDEDITD
jgi:hypothetical protein